MDLRAGEFLARRLVGGRNIRCASRFRMMDLAHTPLVVLEAFDRPILVRLAEEIPQPAANERGEKTASILGRNSPGPFGGGEELETVAGTIAKVSLPDSPVKKGD